MIHAPLCRLDRVDPVGRLCDHTRLSMGYERDNIRRLSAYVPGEQPGYRETANGGFGQTIKLNTNENPYPPSPAVLEAVRGLSPEALRLYPPADAAEFRAAAAEVHGLSPEHVIATNGGDELLRLLFTVYGVPRDLDRPSAGAGGIGVTDPSYSLYPVLAHIQDTPITVIERPDTPDGSFALPERYADQLNRAGCRLACIVNPHAPSGRLEPLETLRALAADFKGLLVVDEAYADFAPHSALPLLRDDGLDNVVVLRSLSKGYALAGLRFGYGLAAPSTIATLDKARDSYNTDILSQAAATAALRDQDYARSTWERVIAERERLAAALRGRGFRVPESHSNFVLATVPPAGPDAPALYRHLKAHHVLIRYFDRPRLRDRLRISVGTPSQNDRLLELLDTAP
ncbi:MAG: aminotransferase class I/II-fold pyridoxal phosphate-dependent enzyme [Planctomycetota bacterium]